MPELASPWLERSLQRGLLLRRLRPKPWQAVLIFAFAYCYWMLWEAFRGGAFGFHDLTLLSDLFANTLRGRPFWVTDYAVNHLSIHFTPTLLLLTPFFLLSSSQFLFVALGLVALYGALALHTWHLEQMLVQRGSVPERTRAVVVAAWAFVLAFNVYTRAVAASAHFEVFYQLLASVVLVGLVHGLRLRWCLLFALLAVGVRPDGGMFLGIQSVGLLLLPGAMRPARTVLAPRAFMVAGLGFLYLLVFLVVIAPALGTPSGTRWWSGYGGTWWEVGWTMLGSPGRVLHAIVTSGLPMFNASFGFVQWLAPWATLAANLPGVFFAIAEPIDKRLLWYYNAAFLLPGLCICAQAGLLRALEWTQASARRWPRLLIARVAPVILAGSLTAWTLWTLPVTAGSPALVRRPATDSPIRAALAFNVERCPERRSVATDFHSVVFVPNTVERFLLRNFERAQVVLVPRQVDTLYLGAPSRDALLETIRKHPRFAEEVGLQGVLVFVRDDVLSCAAE